MHDIFRSASNAARDFPGRIRHTSRQLNSRGQYVIRRERMQQPILITHFPVN
jgi:hypothetical protein